MSPSWDPIWQTVRAIESATTEAECRALYEAALHAPPGWRLEVGCYKGRSTLVLAHASQQTGQPLATVDPLRPYVDLSGPAAESVYPADPAHIRALLAQHTPTVQAEVLQATSTEAGLAWPGERGLGLLWVDGDHSRQGVWTDWHTWSVHLVEGAYVCWHDYHPRGHAAGRWDGVGEVVDELLRARVLEQVSGAGCLLVTRWGTRR